MNQATLDRAREYLCIDPFLATMTGSQSLRTAFEIGLIDALLQQEPSSLDVLSTSLRIDAVGLRFLLGFLSHAGVVTLTHDFTSLTNAFRHALQYRDLLQAKLDFAAVVAPDFVDGLTSLIAEPERFFRSAKLFELFDYGRGTAFTPENYERTKKWMRFTTALTRYEAPVCAAMHDFSSHQRMLDIGGNSGEFALQLCRRNPQLNATIFDLPLVCAAGREHVGNSPEASRINFLSGDARQGALPIGFDLVTFKSMLHDWPEPAARDFLTRATQSLSPGGTLLIFERGPVDIGRYPARYGDLPLLLFFRSYRPPTVYGSHLESLGYLDVTTRWVDLDVPFFLVTARKPR